MGRSHELIHAQMFLDTPHTDDVQVWADRIQTTTEPRHKNDRNWRTKQTLEHAEKFVDITKDFHQLSSLYVIIYFCNEDWLECSEATVSRFLVINISHVFKKSCTDSTLQLLVVNGVSQSPTTD